jgi:RNA polymerase sigma-70 factor, ECF subfamily
LGLESQAFRELAMTEMDSVYRMAMHLARNPEDASDLVQETYLKAFKAEARFELREAGVRPWLFKILHNNFYTRVGKKKREPALADDLSYQADKGGDPNEAGPAWDLAHLDWEQVDDRMKSAIHSLPVHYREVLLLWAVEGLKYREVAEVLEVPLGTVMSRLYRARGILTRSLSDLAAEHGITPQTPREKES